MNMACIFVKKRGGGPEVRGFSLFRKGRMWVVFLVVFALLFAGCDSLEGALDSGQVEKGGKDEPVDGAAEIGDLKDKFGVVEVGTDGIERAFEELSAFIKAGGLTKQPDVISLGDYIDLEGGFKVNAYNNLGGFEHKGTAQAANGTPLLRLIVVGINSFQSVANGYTYPEGKKPPQHVVFQFQNVPVMRRMAAGLSGGYFASEARKYLVPVTAVAGSGNFRAGLLAAGVPEDVLWAPARVLSQWGTNGTVTTVVASDTLWLPTEWEMFGVRKYSGDSETAVNQTRLEYYKTNESRIKYTGEKAVTYWGASPLFATGSGFVGYDRGFFQAVVTSGVAGGYGVKKANGIAPAFCVQ
jgi:hypothetical protein